MLQPNISPGDWIRVGNKDCVVAHLYPEGSPFGVAEVVFNPTKPTTHDVEWDGAGWVFPKRGDFGGYGRRSDKYVQQLLRGRVA